MAKRRWLSVLLSAAMVAGTLAMAVPAQAEGEVEEITWMFWDDLAASTDTVTQTFADTIERFNADYEGQYHVTPITTTLEEYYTQLNALVDAGQTPDVFIVSPGANLTDYQVSGVAAPLNEYLDANDGEWRKVFSSDAVFDGATYDDGGIYAMPLHIAAACVFYNKDIFAEAGAEIPTTYTELLDVCQKIKDAGYTPISISAGTAWCLSMLAGYLCDREGVDLDAVNSGAESWVQDKTIAAGEKLAELTQYFQETAAGDSNDDATTAFYMGEAGILIQGSWAIGQINGGNPDFEASCGVFQFPAIEGGNDPNRIIAKSDSLALSSSSEHKDAAIALMKYFSDDTTQKQIAEVGGKIPVTNVEFDASVAPAQLSDVMEIFGNASGVFGFYNESLVSSDAGSEFDNQMVAIFQGEKTPEEAFQAVEDWYAENGYR